MRLFLDANILFSAAWNNAAAAGLLWELASAGHCELLSSRLAIEEARRNIAAKRPQRMTELESLIGRVLIGREPGKASLSAAGQFGLPGKDVPILAAAIAQTADILLTGDRRDFGHLYDQQIAGISVLPLSDAIEAVLANI